MEGFRIRQAEPEDCEEIVRLIKELADYEKLLHQVELTADELRVDGFNCSSPWFRCLVAERLHNNEVVMSKDGVRVLVGYCLFFNRYSTFQGKAMYLEDIYVSPNVRGRGVASELFQKLAKIAVETHCRRLDLSVLSWNKTKEWYARLGAVDLTATEQWHLYRLNEKDIQSIATRTAGQNQEQ